MSGGQCVGQTLECVEWGGMLSLTIDGQIGPMRGNCEVGGIASGPLGEVKTEK